MKIFLFILLISTSAQGASYKNACSKAVYSLIILKVSDKARQKNLGELDSKFEESKEKIIEKYGDSKSEKKNEELNKLDKMRHEKMEQGKWLYPHSLCENDDVLYMLAHFKGQSNSDVDKCLSTKGRSIFDFDIKSTDTKAKGDKTPKELEKIINEKIQQAYSDIDGVNKCNPQSTYKNMNNFLKEKNPKTRCKMILNDINSANKVAQNCSETLKEKSKVKFSKEQLFKCEMGVDPKNNCPNPDKDDVAKYEESKSQRNIKKLIEPSLRDLCNRGVERACGAMHESQPYGKGSSAISE